MVTGAYELFNAANKCNFDFNVTLMNVHAQVNPTIIEIAPYLIFADTLDVTTKSFQNFLNLSKEPKAMTFVVSAAFKRYTYGQAEQGFALAMKNHYNTPIYPPFINVENAEKRFFPSNNDKPCIWMLQAMLFGGGPCEIENIKKSFYKGNPDLFVFLKQINRDIKPNPNINKIDNLLTEIIESNNPISENLQNLLAQYFVESNIDSVNKLIRYNN